MKQTLVAVVAVAMMGCGVGEVHDPEAPQVAELSASSDTYRASGIETWRKVEVPAGTTIEGLAGNGERRFHLRIRTGRELVELLAPVAQSFELQDGGMFRPLGSYNDQRGFDLFGRYLSDAKGGQPLVIDGQEVHAAPGPDIGGPGVSKECEEARWNCLNATIACLNPLSGCRADQTVCCIYAAAICKTAEIICKREPRPR